MGKRKRPWDYNPATAYLDCINALSPSKDLDHERVAFERLKEIASNITYKNDLEIHVSRSYNFDAVEIRLRMLAPSATRPGEISHLMATELVTFEFLRKATEGELVRLIDHTIRGMEMHEVDEFLKYKGNHVTDPHPERRMVNQVITNYNSDYLVAQYDGSASGSASDAVRFLR